ncbi:MAG: 5-(carboxyamino)imidazole ribonucleotide mutase [Candidatus Hydrogenedens sp.]|nr:5-(carboxyamino)imidazole ribonucleotide mutase [Candidatus Hydrogenedentota bacterium]NLF57024.1 5-(carboxyamino)imidazole ribonucleotide mutase [Candidatus Hydrogenedens sp.]
METGSSPLVSVIMGSESDWETMRRAHRTLAEFGVPHECRVLSAHRTPELLAEYVRESDRNGVEVFITGAGLAAALPGTVAAFTTRPVLGVPIQTGALNGEDALHCIVQMPPGIPVGALAIGTPGATNAALLAIAILANKYPELGEKLVRYRAAQAEKIKATVLPLD